MTQMWEEMDLQVYEVFRTPNRHAQKKTCPLILQLEYGTKKEC
jgi:hypothetical protein